MERASASRSQLQNWNDPRERAGTTSRVIASAKYENRLTRSLRPRKSVNLAIRTIVTSELPLLFRPCTRFLLSRKTKWTAPGKY